MIEPKNFFLIIIPLLIVIGGYIYSFFVTPRIIHKLHQPMVSKVEDNGTIKPENVIGMTTVTYSTKGAFLVNNPIEILSKMEFYDKEILDKEKGKNFYFRMSGAEITERPNDVSQQKGFGGKILLQFDPQTKTWLGKNTVKFTNPGDFGFNISNTDLIDVVQSGPHAENKLHIAPSETNLQLSLNKLILFLTFIMVGFTWTMIADQIYKIFEK
ncbi:MAG: hypothetical protein V1928_01035 [Parcubacteria group bacterium]